GLTTDQRGLGFSRVIGPAADIGAFETATDDMPVAFLDDIVPVTKAGGGSITISVTYLDATAIDVSTLGMGDLTITGPGGFTEPAIFKGVDIATNGSPRKATYDVPAFGGTWDSGDNGRYTISVVPGPLPSGVSDT